MRAQLSHLLQKRMDRKAFLQAIAFGALVLLGMGGIASMWRPEKTQKDGYGMSNYGGKQ